MSSKADQSQDPQGEDLQGFDDFEVSLGDTLRGERATLGVSLLDVQRDLRIKAEYLAAIEDANPDGFDGKGFIAGYVRSYARHLNLDPDWAFRKFCEESGFKGVHGFSPITEKAKPSALPSRGKRPPEGGLGRPMPQSQSAIPWYSKLDPGALSSAAVLVALILGLGYGAVSVFNELQRVTLVPVEATPALLAEVDPLAPVIERGGLDAATRPVGNGPQMATVAPGIDRVDRLFRPQALDVPVLVPRDGPIAAINPDEVGAVAPTPPSLGAPDAVIANAAPGGDAAPATQVIGDQAPEVALLAVAPAWVRVRAADGSVVLEKILNPGERYVLPATEEPHQLRAGAAGAVYFEVSGEVYGPAGAAGSVASGVVLSADAVRGAYELADLTQDQALADIVNVADASGSE